MFSISFSLPLKIASDTTQTTSSLLIQINSPRRNNNVFTSVIYSPFHLLSSSNMSLLRTCGWSTPTLRRETRSLRRCPTHQIRKPFYIILCRQKSPASPENCASELHRVMILRFSKVGGTSCVRMVRYGRVHFFISQSSSLFCMKNWGKINLSRTTWIRFCGLPLKKKPLSPKSTFVYIKWHSSSTSASKDGFPAPLLNKAACRRSNFNIYSPIVVIMARLNPTQVHIQVTDLLKLPINIYWLF